MTPEEMDEAVWRAREIVDGLWYMVRPPVPGSDGARQAMLARALLDTVRERDALRGLCAVLNGDGGHMQVAEGTVAAVEAALDRWHALQARAFAAEQRAERAEAAVAALTTGAQRVLTDERARVVEAIAADVATRSGIAGCNACDREECTTAVAEGFAAHIRRTNWAAPEEES